jgi:hypothetical protein
MFRSKTTFLLVLLYPFVAVAAPTYLDCQLSQGGNEKSKFQVKLDEASGKITHTSYDGSAYNADGFFAANTISYQRIIVESGVKLTIAHEINRTTLRFKQTYLIEALDPKIPWEKNPSTNEGNCSVVKVGARKI